MTHQVPICPAFKVAADEDQTTPCIAACIQLNELFTDLMLFSQSKAKKAMPSNWFRSYESILIGLCRLEKFTLYMRIPPELWTLGWSPMIDLEKMSFPQ